MGPLPRTLVAASLGLATATCGRTPVGEPVHACESVGIPTLACQDTDSCFGSIIEIEAASPEILIQLDRSCSMTPRWVTAVTALHDVLELHGSEAHWGLSVFPDRQISQCVQGELLMPIRRDGAAAVRDTLLAALDPRHEAYPNGPCLTNLAAAIGQSGTDAAFFSGTEQRIVLLITDGWQTCGGQPGDEGAVELAQRLHDERGISTYIISFAGEVDTEALTELAIAGGTAKEGETAYYLSTGDDLDRIIDEIINGLRCSYTLDIEPENLPSLVVTVDGTQVIDRDAADGWTYDPASKTLRFHGQTCEHLVDRGGSVEFELVCG